MRHFVTSHAKKFFVWLMLIVVLNVSIVLMHRYGSIPWQRWFFLWVIGGMSDMVAALVAFGNAWPLRNKNRFISYYVMLLGAIVLETGCALIANILPPIVPDYGTWYTCWFWSGRWTRCFAVWMLVLFQVGWFNGKHAKA